MDIIRLIATISTAGTLLGCATDSVRRPELDEIRASLRALRQENGRLEARLDALEHAAPRPPPVAMSPAAQPEGLPALTVVKLKPKAQAPPRINTHVEVVEPPEGLADALKSGGSQDGPDEADLAMAEAAYQKGVDALKTGSIEGGIAQLRRFVEESPKHPRADNALYYLGLALMAQQDFAGAAEQLEKVAARYPAGDAMLESMVKLAECRVQLHQPQLARATWEKIVSSFPGTPAANQARASLAALEPSRMKSPP